MNFIVPIYHQLSSASTFVAPVLHTLVEGGITVGARLVGNITVGGRIMGNVTVNRTNRFLIGEDNLIVVTGLKDALDDSPTTDATITADIKDRRGTAITGLTGITFTLDTSATNHDRYYGTMNATGTTNMVESREYFMELTISSTIGAGFRKQLLPADFHTLNFDD